MLCFDYIFLLNYLLGTHIYLPTTSLPGDDDTKAMARFDGGYMFVSSLFASLLAFGVSPTEAMGYVAIFCPPLAKGPAPWAAPLPPRGHADPRIGVHG